MPDYAYYLALLAGYSIWLSQLLFVSCAFFLYKSGRTLPASLIGIPTCITVLVSIIANQTTTEELVEMIDEYGEVIGYQMDSNFWTWIQYPSYLTSILTVSIGLVFLVRSVHGEALKR